MENLTLGQIGVGLSFLVGFMGSIHYILNYIDKLLQKKINNIMTEFKEDISSLKISIEKLDTTTCQNYLVSFLHNKEIGKDIDETEEQHAYRIYDHYKNDLHKNSYIHDKWERLMK